MRSNTIYLGILALLLLNACAPKTEETQDSNMAKQIQKIELNEVKAMVLELKTFNKQLISNGKLEAVDKSKLSFATQGKIERINVVEGMSVREGDIIAELDRTDAMLELERSKLAYKKAKMDFADKLLDFGYSIEDTLTAPKEVLEVAGIRSGYYDAAYNLTKAEDTYLKSVIYAPFDGKIASITAKKYETTSSEFCTIVDDKKMNVRFSILESELNLVKAGQGVKVIPFNDSQSEYKGKIIAINPIVDENGQIKLTAAIDNSGGDLIDGQNVKILIEEAVPNQLVVPKSAVVIRDNMEVLFRCNKGKSLWTYVNVVMANSEEYVVAPNLDRKADLSIGDSIIVSGNLNLGDNAAIKVIK